MPKPRPAIEPTAAPSKLSTLQPMVAPVEMPTSGDISATCQSATRGSELDTSAPNRPSTSDMRTLEVNGAGSCAPTVKPMSANGQASCIDRGGTDRGLMYM